MSKLRRKTFDHGPGKAGIVSATSGAADNRAKQITGTLSPEPVQKEDAYTTLNGLITSINDDEGIAHAADVARTTKGSAEVLARLLKDLTCGRLTMRVVLLALQPKADEATGSENPTLPLTDSLIRELIASDRDVDKSDEETYRTVIQKALISPATTKTAREVLTNGKHQRLVEKLLSGDDACALILCPCWVMEKAQHFYEDGYAKQLRCRLLDLASKATRQQSDGLILEFYNWKDPIPDFATLEGVPERRAKDIGSFVRAVAPQSEEIIKKAGWLLGWAEKGGREDIIDAFVEWTKARPARTVGVFQASVAWLTRRRNEDSVTAETRQAIVSALWQRLRETSETTEQANFILGQNRNAPNPLIRGCVERVMNPQSENNILSKPVDTPKIEPEQEKLRELEHRLNMVSSLAPEDMTAEDVLEILKIVNDTPVGSRAQADARKLQLAVRTQAPKTYERAEKNFIQWLTAQRQLRKTEAEKTEDAARGEGSISTYLKNLSTNDRYSTVIANIINYDPDPNKRAAALNDLRLLAKKLIGKTRTEFEENQLLGVAEVYNLTSSSGRLGNEDVQMIREIRDYADEHDPEGETPLFDTIALAHETCCRTHERNPFLG